MESLIPVTWTEMMKQSHPVISALKGGFKAGTTIQRAKEEFDITKTNCQNPEKQSPILKLRKYKGNIYLLSDYNIYIVSN